MRAGSRAPASGASSRVTYASPPAGRGRAGALAASAITTPSPSLATLRAASMTPPAPALSFTVIAIVIGQESWVGGGDPAGLMTRAANDISNGERIGGSGFGASG